MSLANLLSQTASIKRSQAVGTNGRTQQQTLYSNVACQAFPMSRATAIEHEFSLGRAYNVYFNVGQDVQTGDQLVIGSDTYDVRFVKAYSMSGVGHTLALCEQEVS